MPLQDVLEANELSDEVIRYCMTMFRVFTGSSEVASVARHPSPEFNALIETEDLKTYRIWVHDGLIARLREALERLEAETIHDEVLAISEAVLGDQAHAHICYRVWLVQSIIFVVLHELGHAMRGHLAYLAELRGDAAKNLALAEVQCMALARDGPALDPHLLHLFELEADEFAADRMLALANELFLEDVGAREIIVRLGRDADNVDEIVRRKAEELSFYSACTSMALIEAHGDRGPSHPLPFTRMLHLSNAYVRRFLPKPADALGVQEVQLTGNDRQAFVEAVVPPLFNAMDIVENCWAVAGVDLSDRFHVPDDGKDISLAGRLASDLVATLISKPAKLIPTERARYEELLQHLLEFHELMKPYRLSVTSAASPTSMTPSPDA